jgi:hypothetical protein
MVIHGVKFTIKKINVLIKKFIARWKYTNGEPFLFKKGDVQQVS